MYSAAEAVFRLLRHMPRRKWIEPCYRRVPGFAPASESTYRFIANHRNLAGWITNRLWGLDYEPEQFHLGRWLFLRNLGLIFLVAFWSLQTQILGLMGSWGVLPAAELIAAVESQAGPERYWQMPTVYWFINPSDGSFLEMCALGITLGAIIAIGLVTPVIILMAAIAYLSLVNIGGDFMSFQWDILLIETAILATLFAPFQLFPHISRERAPSNAVRWLLWLLLFKLMFLSGYVKLDDPTWTELRALDFHYETQPLPTAAAWYAHQLPPWFQGASVVVMFAIEMGAPFLIFTPRRIRHIGAILLIFLQVIIAITGNYTFFNWLTIALCLLLFDDQFYRSLMPKKIAKGLTIGEFSKPIFKPLRVLYAALFVVFVTLSATVMLNRIAREVTLPPFAVSLYRWTAPFRLSNGYGLFAHMTTARHEITIEGSNDGENWKPYVFRWKPGDPALAPRLIAPHQPRLDWQMWFAALGNANSTPWFSAFVMRLFEGSPSVDKLLAVNPFPDTPPRYIRATRDEYHFSDWETRRTTGDWWVTQPAGLYLRPVQLP